MGNDDLMRKIPQVEKLLQNDGVREFLPVLGRAIVLDAVRAGTARFRASCQDGAPPSIDVLYDEIRRDLEGMKRMRLQRVINGTGVIIHTNLGRSPLGPAVLEKLRGELSGFCNLELYLPEKKRGKRGGFAEMLVSSLAGSEDALIVNNNAASVYLILSEFARGRETIVSRGELIQIGGGFRIPDIMEQTGTRLVEVGTTNITELDDYRSAIGPATGMIFSAHRSNFALRGFSSEVSLKELAGFKSDSLLLVRDLGSGNLVHDRRLGPRFEPSVSSELSQGADLVCFSGDKLLGGCQAGIIVGRKDLIARLRKNPLMRILRVDKIAYYILQETMLCYVNGEIESVPVWSMILQERGDIEKKVARFLRLIKHPGKVKALVRVPLESTFGGGSMPDEVLPSAGLRVEIPGMQADGIGEYLIAREVPVVGYVADDGFFLDFRTVLPEDIAPLADSLQSLLNERLGSG
jgi:L-seryl-tRNA(Ser) seleniumtransferase